MGAGRSVAKQQLPLANEERRVLGESVNGFYKEKERNDDIRRIE